MSKALPENADIWLCEKCGDPHVGENPPDNCLGCGHSYFANMADVERELAEKDSK